jgi:alkylated DNA repair dioxygenase AlkB
MHTMNNLITNLFTHEPTINLLPHDGQVHYHGPIMSHDEAMHHHEKLLAIIPWQHDEAVIYGKRIITARKVAWVGDTHYAYTYSGTTKQATPWTSQLLMLKSKVQVLTETVFNSCLLNLYHHGQEGMAWHSDDESSLGKNTTIASLSFGATRKFAFRHKHTKETLSLMLDPGSLLVMKGTTQTHWQHSLLKSARVHSPRINLTFRTIII